MATQTYEKALLLQVYDDADCASGVECAVVEVTRALYAQLADYGMLAIRTAAQADSLHSIEFWNYAATYCAELDDGALMERLNGEPIALANFSYNDDHREDGGATVRTDCDTLIVVPRKQTLATVEFHFTAVEKHSDIHFSTAWFKLVDVMKALEQAA